MRQGPICTPKWNLEAHAGMAAWPTFNRVTAGSSSGGRGAVGWWGAMGGTAAALAARGGWGGVRALHLCVSALTGNDVGCLFCVQDLKAGADKGVQDRAAAGRQASRVCAPRARMLLAKQGFSPADNRHAPPPPAPPPHLSSPSPITACSSTEAAAPSSDPCCCCCCCCQSAPGIISRAAGAGRAGMQAMRSGGAVAA